jgi:myosin protein heavy chain
LEKHETAKTRSQRSNRNVDRAVKDLQGQLERKDKQNTQLSEDVSRMREKVDKLLKTIDELQASESTNQLSTRRAERDLREEKEKSLRLEREVESLKSLKGGSSVGSGSIRSRMSQWRIAEAEDKEESGINRAHSMTKGFL